MTGPPVPPLSQCWSSAHCPPTGILCIQPTLKKSCGVPVSQTRQLNPSIMLNGRAAVQTCVSDNSAALPLFSLSITAACLLLWLFLPGGALAFLPPLQLLPLPDAPGRARPAQVRLLLSQQLLTQLVGPLSPRAHGLRQSSSQWQLGLSLADLMLAPLLLGRGSQEGLATSVLSACLLVFGLGQQCAPTDLILCHQLASGQEEEKKLALFYYFLHAGHSSKDSTDTGTKRVLLNGCRYPHLKEEEIEIWRGRELSLKSQTETALSASC